jgi:acyl-CoA synthetase (AMP-forming)/AMP-acid ligase II
MSRSITYNIADLFESLVAVIPDREAVVCGPRRLTFAQLDDRANRIAGHLAAQGIGAGDQIGLHLFNGTEYLEVMIAAFKLRAVPVNLNYRYVAAELRFLVTNADLVAIFSQRELCPRLEEAMQGLPALRTLVLLDDGSGPPTTRLAYHDYEDLLASASALTDFPQRSGDDLYVIYTGGTTGMPKGVMWRHEDIFFAGLQGGAPGGEPISAPEQLAENAVSPDAFVMAILPAAPFIHGAAQFGAWIALFTGGKVVLSSSRTFDAVDIWSLVERERVTTITLVGDAMARPMLDALQAAPIEAESLVAIASAGAILSPSIRDGLQALLPNTLVLNNFGASETGHQGTAYPGAEPGPDGRPTFLMDETNTVLDDDLKVAEVGKMGRLARSGRVPLGYYKDAELTAQRFVTLDGQRWVLPGDFAIRNDDGTITLLGRGSVCINTGGEKVFPEEVEEALKAHPDVYDALVVGVPDARWGERVAAVVQRRPGTEPEVDALIAHCRQFVAGYKVPRQVTWVEQIARQPSGKPDYRWGKEIASKENP